ncbi:hypothetical protein P154DRAFT_615568 [Amniculicola lignicola CBS 123094]|uniref:Chromatin modification-related protein n=1 Tax=Amniculicola lignicola CBS 123094 TaxID=1392246 RepID=A0A6A5WYZ2_9PLEO|nr:hypothetical protein P154DRAFT_615568 [Amniculicola lignicola CBS 123094]
MALTFGRCSNARGLSSNAYYGSDGKGCLTGEGRWNTSQAKTRPESSCPLESSSRFGTRKAAGDIKARRSKIQAKANRKIAVQRAKQIRARAAAFHLTTSAVSHHSAHHVNPQQSASPPIPHRPSPALSAAPILFHAIIDAWLDGLTRPSGTPPPERSPRCAMAEDAAGSALSDMTPQPTANPDAHTTVNDFLDYTEYFPSDLVRSLRLIGDLDSTYDDATQTVHELTRTYGRLPDIPASERPDPVSLRSHIAAALDKAISCRESSLAEATRLYEVAERHSKRLGIIKTKLQALPQPPSRDPTPAPVSPQATRPLNRSYDKTPRLHLHFDTSRHGANTSRPRDRSRKNVTSARGRSRRHSTSSVDSQADSVRSGIQPTPKKSRKEKAPRVRQGTNVHSSVAGISTSNALALLEPPPPNAKPGSKHAPWFKLTEYEMAVLRKQMKKNAFWCPSDTMIRRELEKKGRGNEAFDLAVARCAATGEELLNEEPEPPPARNEDVVMADAEPPVAPETPPAPVPPPPPVEPVQETTNENTVAAIAVVNKGEPKEERKVNRESRRAKAGRDIDQLEEITQSLGEAAEILKEIKFAADAVDPAPVTRRKSTIKLSNKRKRDSTPPAVETSATIANTTAASTPVDNTREPSLASQDQDSSTKQPDPKRLRLIAPAPPSPAAAPSPSVPSTPQPTTPAAPTPVAAVLPPLVTETIKTTTIQVPLAPSGPGTPKSATKPPSKVPSRHVTPAVPSPTENKKSPINAAPLQSTTVTAASSRPRRESVAPHKVPSPVEAPVLPAKMQKTPPPVPEPSRSSPMPMPPRSSRGHVPTPKAQSEEPKPNESGKPRELRRHSIFSQSAMSQPLRMSTRKKPPPKGEVTSNEDGQKTVTNVKRAQGNKNKKRKPVDEPMESDDIDPDEPKYCVCDDVSWGEMIQCDNHCEKDWFHLECLNMTAKDLPPRRAKWYCPECREKLNTDAYGNPLKPPPLPGRRGNRRNLPPDIEALFTKTPAIKDVLELALGDAGTYFISYRDHDGEIYARHYNLPNPLTTYLYASHPHIIRDLSTLSITLGPYESYYANDKTSASWANLPPVLDKAVQSRLESQDAWKTVWKENGREAPSFISLGADGSYFMRTVGGGGSWDLKGKSEGMGGTNKFLEESKDFTGIAGLYLFPQQPQSYVLLLTTGKAFSNLPEHTWEDYNKMADKLPSLVQTAAPIPAMPQARPLVQQQPLIQPQLQQQMLPQQPLIQNRTGCCPTHAPHNCCPPQPQQQVLAQQFMQQMQPAYVAPAQPQFYNGQTMGVVYQQQPVMMGQQQMQRPVQMQMQQPMMGQPMMGQPMMGQPMQPMYQNGMMGPR